MMSKSSPQDLFVLFLSYLFSLFCLLWIFLFCFVAIKPFVFELQGKTHLVPLFYY